MDKLNRISMFDPEDLPLVLDATFAMAIHAYALVLYLNVPNDFEIRDVLMERFKQQGFDTKRADKVSKIIDETLHKMIMDAKREL